MYKVKIFNDSLLLLQYTAVGCADQIWKGVEHKRDTLRGLRGERLTVEVRDANDNTLLLKRIYELTDGEVRSL